MLRRQQRPLSPQRRRPQPVRLPRGQLQPQRRPLMMSRHRQSPLVSHLVPPPAWQAKMFTCLLPAETTASACAIERQVIRLRLKQLDTRPCTCPAGSNYYCTRDMGSCCCRVHALWGTLEWRVREVPATCTGWMGCSVPVFGSDVWCRQLSMNHNNLTGGPSSVACGIILCKQSVGPKPRAGC